MKKIILTISVVILCACIGSLRAETNAPQDDQPTNIGVPAECEDVMLQAFYWDSYKLTKYGRTKWLDLMEDTAAIRDNFDLVWFPPASYAGGDANDGYAAGGVGYYHRQLSQMNSAWGNRIGLDKLIKALHRGGTKCLADIVINHRNNKSNWCDFFEDSFGTYGRFQFNESHICKGDECFTKSESTCYGSTNKGAADTGTNDAGCRDLDHSNEYVQNWAKAYVQWMLDKIGFDGFRYDMTRGYDGKYLSMYNEAANPYVSVSEFWMDNVSDQIAHLKAANYNTMIFDFPLKWAIGNAFKTGSYSGLKNPANSLRGKGLSRYSVTFIDNHDTFERSDNQGGEFIRYNADLNSEEVKNKILQANAYILMMPGVPCVFWPHWRKYTSEINRMIAIRKAAGIHSESEVTDEDAAGYKYSATIQGHYGRVYLRLGKNRDTTQPANTYKAMEGSDYTIYVEGGQGVETVSDAKRGEKFMKNGQLYIRHGEKTYDAMGREVRGEK